MTRPATRRRTRGTPWLAGVLVLAAAGCGARREADYGDVELTEVSGRVTLDGQPLAGAIVVFEAADRGFSYGRTDEAGDYRLLLNSEKSGVLPGPKTVRIRTSGGLGEDAAPVEEDSPPAAATRELVPACYNTQSHLQVTVEGRSQSLNFNLLSDCSTRGPS